MERLAKCPCYALQVDGYYYALMMVAIQQSAGRSGSIITFNLIGVLQFRSKTLPTRAVFESRRWMRLYFGEWGGDQLVFWCHSQKRFEAERLIPIAEVDSQPDDPFECPVMCQWPGAMEILKAVSALPRPDSKG
ncbi:MAG: hypothetical protein ABSH20_16740 [Tepidisphaeraceae bacterium]